MSLLHRLHTIILIYYIIYHMSLLHRLHTIILIYYIIYHMSLYTSLHTSLLYNLSYEFITVVYFLN